jgi:histidine ammonia-lyase
MPLPERITRAPVVRAVMLLLANVLLRATSGVRPDLVEALVAMLNAGVVPLVQEQGSVGASGDLAPLSHIALALMGEDGVVVGGGSSSPAADVVREAGLRTFSFAP